MRRTAMLTGAAGLVGVLMMVAGCSGHDAAKSSSLRGAPDVNSVPADGAVAGAAKVPSAQSDQSAKRADGPSAAPLVSAALIRTADLEVRVPKPDDVAAQANRAGDIAVNAGGRVDSDDRSSGDQASATLTLKVPPDELTTVLTKLTALGRPVSRSSSTRDVTQEVADVTSRVRSAQLAIDQLDALFRQATKLGDIITLERELAQREADLESLQAQQRALDAQTSLATVTLRLTSVPPAAGTKKHHAGGFAGGFARGWDAFTGAATGLLIALGAVLPFLAVVLVIGAAGLAWRRQRRRSVPLPTPEPS